MFARRLGIRPSEQPCRACYGCPSVWLLDDGDFAVVGADLTERASELPAGAGCAPDERMVRIPRSLMLQALEDIHSPSPQT